MKHPIHGALGLVGLLGGAIYGGNQAANQYHAHCQYTVSNACAASLSDVGPRALAYGSVAALVLPMLYHLVKSVGRSATRR